MSSYRNNIVTPGTGLVERLGEGQHQLKCKCACHGRAARAFRVSELINDELFDDHKIAMNGDARNEFEQFEHDLFPPVSKFFVSTGRKYSGVSIASCDGAGK